MNGLHTLKDPSERKFSGKRVGRGPGSGKGKTSGRGHKGQKSRSGYKRRYGKEGGQFPLYMKVPTRGFTRGRFKSLNICVINLSQIEDIFNDGDVVNLQTLTDHGFTNKASECLKILAGGELSKKVSIEAHAYSAAAEEKLEKAGHTYKKI